jgi:hypothetical protein
MRSRITSREQHFAFGKLGFPKAGGASGKIVNRKSPEQLSTSQQLDDAFISGPRCHVDPPCQSQGPIEQRCESYGNIAALADPRSSRAASLLSRRPSDYDGRAIIYRVAPNPGEVEIGAATGMSRQFLRPLVVGAVTALSILFGTTLSALSQGSECALVADDRNPSEQILRCGADLVVRTAPGTRYHPIDQQGNEPPKALQLDAGALMIEFHPSEAQKNFQILTPHAIAAVRGTKWVVDVISTRTSTLVISGEVAVSRPHANETVVLKAGQGADVSAGTGSIAAKRWPNKRVRALLARFGE